MTALAERPQEPIVLTRAEDGIVHVTLNRPAQYNALSTELMETLREELERIAGDEAAKVVVLGGAGKGFCAGHDLKELRANPSREFYEGVFRQCSRLMLTITRMRQPVIAAVHGIATAAGCQLVATADLAVAADTARFATPGVNIGLFCSTPMVALSRNVARKHAMKMLLTGEMIDATAAVRYGLVNECVPEAELEARTLDLARTIAEKSPLVLSIGKEAFYRQLEVGLAQAYEETSEVMVRNMMARDAEEGIDAFIEKRSPTWRGC